MRQIAERPEAEETGHEARRRDATCTPGATSSSRPGTNSKYSNYGYLLASLVVETVTGQGYFDYVKTAILDKEKLTGVAVSPTRAASWPGDQAIAEDPGLWLSPHATSRRRRSCPRSTAATG